MAAVTICSDFGAQGNKVSHCFLCFLSICHEVMGPDAMILAFWISNFGPAFSLSSFTFIKRFFSSSLPFAIRVVSSAYSRLLIFLLLLLSRFSRVRLCATPWTAAYQASLSMGLSRQEHWSGLPFPSPDISPSNFDPAYASSSLAFCMMYSTWKLNKQGDNIQPWCTPFPIWNQSVVPCSVLTVASWPAYRFLRRQVRWSGIPIPLRIFHRFSKWKYRIPS